MVAVGGEAFSRAWYERISPGGSAWSAWVGGALALVAVQFAFIAADSMQSQLGAAATPLVAWLVRWSVLIVVVPMLALATVCVFLGYESAVRTPNSWLRAAGWGGAVMCALVIGYLAIDTLAELRLNLGP